MYNGFFGFKEKPFKLIPNPDFLFLGTSHEDALAHLTYATAQGDGFVEITGEVGTGKTTLCRVFLEDLDENTEAAFIFNPKLTAVQLLKEIHAELGIEPIPDDPVELTHSLNRYLLRKKTQGKNVILLIDEAQHLEKDTLEQLRMLSNLETTKSKLLQIILVGQPELGDTLDSFEMRQLRQRINLSCHILPLTSRETTEYVMHRVQVASRKPQDLFTRDAMALIYRHSGGIPRRINIICDRALLAAYSMNRTKVDGNSIKTAVRELDGASHGNQPTSAKNQFLKIATAALLLSGIITAGIFMYLKDPLSSTNQPGLVKGSSTTSQTDPRVEKETGRSNPNPSIEKASKPPISAVASQNHNPAVHPAVTSIAPALTVQSPVDATLNMPSPDVRFSGRPQSGMNRYDAMYYLFSRWHVDPGTGMSDIDFQIQDDDIFFKMAARQNRFLMVKTKYTPGLLKKLKVPVLFTLKDPENAAGRYLILEQITADDHCIFQGTVPEEKIRLYASELSTFFEAAVHITCSNLFGTEHIIGKRSTLFSILDIKLFLRKLGYPGIELSQSMDPATISAVKQIQVKYGLEPDGIIGPMTQVIFSVEAGESDRLVPEAGNNEKISAGLLP